MLALLLNPGDLSWENLDLTGTPIQNFSTGGSTLGYQADFHLAPNGGPTGVPNTATLDVSLPPGFIYQAGSTQLLINAVPAPNQPGNPTVLSDGTLRWTVNVNVGTNYSLLFTTRPGLTLGPTARDGEDHSWQAASSRRRRRPPRSPSATRSSRTTPRRRRSPISTDPVNGSGDSFNLSYLTSKLRRRLLHVPDSGRPVRA